MHAFTPRAWVGSIQRRAIELAQTAKQGPNTQTHPPTSIPVRTAWRERITQLPPLTRPSPTNPRTEPDPDPILNCGDQPKRSSLCYSESKKEAATKGKDGPGSKSEGR